TRVLGDEVMRERELDRFRARVRGARVLAHGLHFHGRTFTRVRAARLARHQHRACAEHYGRGDADAERDEQRSEKIDDDQTYPGPAARSFHLESPSPVARPAFGPCTLLKHPNTAPPGEEDGELAKNCGRKMAMPWARGPTEEECAIFCEDLFPLLFKEGWREAPGWSWRLSPPRRLRRHPS